MELLVISHVSKGRVLSENKHYPNAFEKRSVTLYKVFRRYWQTPPQSELEFWVASAFSPFGWGKGKNPTYFSQFPSFEDSSPQVFRFVKNSGLLDAEIVNRSYLSNKSPTPSELEALEIKVFQLSAVQVNISLYQHFPGMRGSSVSIPHSARSLPAPAIPRTSNMRL